MLALASSSSTRQQIELDLQHTVRTLLRISRLFCAAPHIDWSSSSRDDREENDATTTGDTEDLFAIPPAQHSTATNNATTTTTTTTATTPLRQRFVVVGMPALHCVYRAYAFVYFGCVLVAFYTHQYRQISQQSALTEKTVYAAHYATYFLQYLLIIVGTQRQHRQYPCFVRRLAAIDVRLMRLQVAIERDCAGGGGGVVERHQQVWTTTRCSTTMGFETWRRRYRAENAILRRYIAAVLVVLFAVMGTTLCIDVLVYRALTAAMWLRSVVVYLFSHATDYLVLLQMIVVLRMLRTRYRAVNALLKRTLSACVVASTAPGGGAQLKPRPTKKETITVAARLVMLRNLRRLHYDLQALHARLTGAFGLLLVFLVVNTVLDLTVEMYTIYRFMVRFADWWMAAYTGLWMCMYCVKVLAVLWFSELVERERQLYALTVGETRRSSDLGDRGLNEQLFKIQMQALHDREPQMACDIAPLNLSLFTTILGSLTGLLVMLIQFESSVITAPPSI